MYVKLYNKILDSSIAGNRKLRHFFIDLLLCSDPEGNVIMTKEAIARRVMATVEEVEWGLKELMKPEKGSFNTEQNGRRIIPLDGLGYGWKIVSYEHYRDMKSAKELRDSTKERVRRFREKQRGGPRKKALPPPGEGMAVAAEERGEGMEGVIEMVAREQEANRGEAGADL